MPLAATPCRIGSAASRARSRFGLRTRLGRASPAVALGVRGAAGGARGHRCGRAPFPSAGLGPEPTETIALDTDDSRTGLWKAHCVNVLRLRGGVAAHRSARLEWLLTSPASRERVQRLVAERSRIRA